MAVNTNWKRLGPLVFLLFPLCTTSAANEKVQAAYWIQDTIPAQSIDSTLFSHLFCAYATLDSSANTISLPDASFSTFSSAVRAKNPSLKTLLSIGTNVSTARAFASPASRKTFIHSTIAVARSNSFDGLDLAYVPSTASDMSNLGVLLSEWRAAVDAESASTNRPRLLLTASVHYTNTNIPPASDPYPAQSIAANLDWINVQAYYFAAPASWGTPNMTEPTASLYDPASHVSGSDGVDAWIQAGVPATKIVLGIPFFGYAWRLTDPSDHGYGAPAAGPAFTGDGSVTYNGVVDFVNSNAGAVKRYDSSKGNYCYDGDTWISYDDVEAVTAKVKYVEGNGLLGYIAWQIGGDDDAFTLSTTAAASLTTRVLPILLGILCYE